MDSRRNSRTVIDPKVRQVGFFTPNAAPPSRTHSGPPESRSLPLSDSPATNSLSPVMIPPPRHLSDNLTSRTAAVPVPDSSLRRPGGRESVAVGSYNPDDSVLGTSPVSRIGDGEFSEESPAGWFPRTNLDKFPSTSPIETQVKKQLGLSPEKTTEIVTEVRNELPSSSKPLKEKTTKAERRALQEAQRAAKASAKGLSCNLP